MILLPAFYLLMLLFYGWSKLGDEVPDPEHTYIRREMTEDDSRCKGVDGQ